MYSFDLAPEQKMVREMTRKFCEREIEPVVPDLDERLTYACGPAGLLDALEEHHAERGLPLTTERFRPVLVAAGEGGKVSFTSGTVVEADGATPILDAAESAGVLMPSGCRMGICMGCVIPLKEGVVRDLRNGALTTAVAGETGPGGVPIQTCINATPANGILELPAGVYRIDHQVTVSNAPIILRTENTDPSMAKCDLTNHTCAELSASTAFAASSSFERSTEAIGVSSSSLEKGCLGSRGSAEYTGVPPGISVGR